MQVFLTFTPQDLVFYSDLEKLWINLVSLKIRAFVTCPHFEYDPQC
jgi:hypothetical protein